MRRSLCISEPSVALAGQIKTWKFVYTPSANLPKGTQLKFDFVLENRPSDWTLPQTNLKEKENLIWVSLPNKKTVHFEEILEVNHSFPVYECTLPIEIAAGDSFEILVGTPGKDQSKGNMAQTVTQRRKPFHLYVDPKGKGDYKDPEIFSIDVRGNVLEKINILTPSFISKNRRFDIVVRFEDEHGNLTSNAPEGTLIQLSYEFLRENLNWKLFVPETGFIILPNFYFNEAGIYKIKLNTSTSEKVFYSTPIKCLPDNDFSMYWGTFHGESQKYDAADSIEAFLRHIRDEKGYQFIGSSPFESITETTNDIWKAISSNIQEYNEENRFTTMLGLQWFGDEKEGLRQIIYWKDNKPMMRKKDSKYTSLKKIYKIHSTKEILAIPSFTMAQNYETDFSDYNPDFEKVVEIYNAWGCSECSEKEGNLRPIKSPSKNGINETEKGSLRNALNRNVRFGFVAGGLDDRGIYAPLFESDQLQYSPGLTCIIALEQTRETLMQAICNRSCYATTGAKMVIGLYIAGSQMGTELSTKNKPGLAFNRYITGFVCGTAPIKEILIIRNGKPHHAIHPKAETFEFEYDDFEDMEKIALNSPDERPPFVYYYMRVLQEDGHIAWSSPIWVDLSDSISIGTSKKSKKKSTQ